MSNSQVNLTDLIGSRICHDLISPLGAISNGVELLSISGGPVGPEMSLISESIENANARIRFFRIAYGAADAKQEVGNTEIVSILRDMSRGGRLNTDWQPLADLPRPQVKLAFLLLQCYETAMPWGGSISVSRVGDQWARYGQGEKLKIDPELWKNLSPSEPADRLRAANVQFALAPLAAASMNRALSVELSERSIRVRF